MAEKRFHVPDGVRTEFSGVGHDELLRIYEELDLPGHKVEFYDGRIVVGPSASRQHIRIVMRLRDALQDICEERGWEALPDIGLYSAPQDARAGIPLYMVIDPLEDPWTVTLYSQPKGAHYQTVTQITAEDPLNLPEPFGITLDTGVLLD